jgi:hypothetical protein
MSDSLGQLVCLYDVCLPAFMICRLPVIKLEFYPTIFSKGPGAWLAPLLLAERAAQSVVLQW